MGVCECVWERVWERERVINPWIGTLLPLWRQVPSDLCEQSLSGKLINIDEWQSAQQAVNTIAPVALGQSQKKKQKPQIAKTIKTENQKYKNRKIFLIIASSLKSRN